MFFKEMFSSSNSASWGRFGSFLALIFSLLWITYVVYTKQTLTDPATLLGHAGFISALYAIGKINETVQNGQNGQTPPEPPKAAP